MIEEYIQGSEPSKHFQLAKAASVDFVPYSRRDVKFSQRGAHGNYSFQVRLDFALW